MNNKNLQVANFFWGGELSSYEIANILSFKKNNFKVNVWSYQELDLPDGINLCDAGKIISKDYLSFLHEDDKNSTIQRSHELAEIYEQNKSPILESDVIHRLKNKNGDFIQLFCHIRANLELKQSKMWCVPLPDNER